jgi:hypothetical protein
MTFRRIVFQDVCVVESDDGKQAKIAEFGREDLPVFVRFQSWDTTKEHEIMSLFEGKTVRVTVEVIDD